MNGTMHTAIIRTFVESRRAVHEVLSALWDLLQAGSVMEWPDDDPPVEPAPVLAHSPAPRLRGQLRGPTRRAKLSPTSNAALRLITPRSLKDSFPRPPSDGEVGSPLTSGEFA